LVDGRVAQVPGREPDGAGDRAAQTDERFDELVLAVARHAGDPHDLAGPDREVDTPYDLLPAVVVDAQSRDVEDDLAGMRPSAIDAEAHGPSDHELGELVLRAARWRAATDDPPAPDHRDAVGDLEDLVQRVADEDHGRAFRAELPEHAEDLARLLWGQDGRRLVEDEDPGAPVDGLQDLHAL